MLTLRKGSRMFSGKTLLVLGLGLSLCLTTLAATAAGLLRPAIDFPLSVGSYHDEQIPSLFGNLRGGFSGSRSTSLRFFFAGLCPRFLPKRKRLCFQHARIEQLSQIRRERGSCGLPFSTLPSHIARHLVHKRLGILCRILKGSILEFRCRSALVRLLSRRR